MPLRLAKGKYFRRPFCCAHRIDGGGGDGDDDKSSIVGLPFCQVRGGFPVLYSTDRRFDRLLPGPKRFPVPDDSFGPTQHQIDCLLRGFKFEVLEIALVISTPFFGSACCCCWLKQKPRPYFVFLFAEKKLKIGKTFQRKP